VLFFFLNGGFCQGFFYPGKAAQASRETYSFREREREQRERERALLLQEGAFYIQVHLFLQIICMTHEWFSVAKGFMGVEMHSFSSPRSKCQKRKGK
jgi:hypothetical protein